MAIVKITDFSSGTTPVSGDWPALVNHFNAYTRQITGLQFIVSGTVIKLGSYISHGGSLYQVQTEDYTILGTYTANVFNYIKVAACGESLTATWITNIDGYTWSNIYNYFVATDESQLLSIIEKDSIVSRLEQNNMVFNKISTKEGLCYGLFTYKNYVTGTVGPYSTIGSMKIGEIKIVSHTHFYSNSYTNPGQLYLPSTGHYLIIGAWDSTNVAPTIAPDGDDHIPGGSLVSSIVAPETAGNAKSYSFIVIRID